METQKALKDSEGFDWLESTELAIDNRIYSTRLRLDLLRMLQNFLFPGPLSVLLRFNKTVNNQTLSVFYSKQTYFIYLKQTGRLRVPYIVKHSNTFWSGCILHKPSRIRKQLSIVFNLFTFFRGDDITLNREGVCLQCVFHTKPSTHGNFREDACLLVRRRPALDMEEDSYAY